jgi:hypothetical protein
MMHAAICKQNYLITAINTTLPCGATFDFEFADNSWNSGTVGQIVTTSYHLDFIAIISSEARFLQLSLHRDCMPSSVFNYLQQATKTRNIVRQC